MPTLRTMFVQDGFADSAGYAEVMKVSDDLLAHLVTPAANALMVAANLPGQSSAGVQETFAPFAANLGFISEAKGLFVGYDNKALRPDYFLRMGDTGILMEVERGKTTTNNMDLLDLWKCHLCVHAHYLFLMVPQALRHNAVMTPKKEYGAVVKRLGSFFTAGNYVNVRGLHVFGY